MVWHLKDSDERADGVIAGEIMHDWMETFRTGRSRARGGKVGIDEERRMVRHLEEADQHTDGVIAGLVPDMPETQHTPT